MLSDKIEMIIATLKGPLSVDEENAGWTKQSKEGYVPLFGSLLSSLRGGEQIPYVGLARSLDGWGIGDGDLYKNMMEVANEINSRSS